MRLLSELLQGFTYECTQGSVDVNVDKVVYDSRKVEEHCVFICISGANFDGHSIAAEAVQNGAVAIIAQRDVTVPSHLTVIRVEDTRYAMAHISAAYFGYPATQMKMIGITGTKGKYND